MVLIPAQSYAKAYNRILSSARRNHSVYIVCAPDIDALCACRILTQLLKNDHIGYKILPVGGWEELSRVAEEIGLDESVGTLVLLNLGGIFDLSEFFSLSNQTTLHLIDSHRPTNLSNLFGSRLSADEGEVWVWDDGNGEDDLQEEKRAFQRLEFEPESDDEDNSEEYSEDEMLPNGRRRFRTGSSTDSEDEHGGPSKRRRLSEEGDSAPILSRRDKTALKKRILKYYSTGTYYGQSIASQLYALSSSLGRASPDLLWLSILGLTHQYTAALIDRDRYDAYADVYRTEVRRMMEDNIDKGADDRDISEEEELQFRLFRHWNLFDSMLHSSYVAGKLELWREKGRKRLQGLLAKMGFSLDQCNQTYSHMDPQLKRSLRASLLAIAPDYGLYQLTFPSFVRSYGFRSQLSASDAVEAVGAILEIASRCKISDGEFVGVNDGEWGQSTFQTEDAVPADDGAEDDAVVAARRKTRDRDGWIYNFWRAHDALGPDTALLRSALPLSMSIHRAIVRQGTSLIDKQSIKTLSSFRLVTIKEGPDLTIFSHPSTLFRLAIWLVDAVRDLVERGKKGKVKSLPFVVCCLDEPNDCWVVVGVTGAAEYGDVRKNKFGLAFKEAAHTSAARVRSDRFEADVIEIRKDDLLPFIGKLQVSL